MKRLATLRAASLYIALGLVSVPVLVPFFWMVTTSLKSREAAAANPPVWLPVRVDGYGRPVPGAPIEPNWENYTRVLAPGRRSEQDDVPRFLLNTLVICGMTVAGQILSSSVVGWGFARLRFAGRRLLFMAMLSTLMLPGQIAMIPTFMLYRQLGWIDTFLPLIVPAWFGSAFFAFLYRQHFLGIPAELDEAATADGCSPFGVFRNVLLPMAKPVSVTVGVYAFLGAWNDFLGPLIYLNSDHKRTLALALAKFQGAYSTDVPALMAFATLMLLPVLAIYFASQRALVQGMVVTGLKG